MSEAQKDQPEHLRSRLFASLPLFLLLLTVALSAFFYVNPQLDILVSKAFYSDGLGFPLSENRLLLFLRNVHRSIPHIVTVVCVVVLVLHRLEPAKWLPPIVNAFYVATFMILGPGLLVDVIKAIVGRARPRDLIGFGGEASFTRAWELSSACHSNCSFISGEGASGAAMLVLPMLLPERHRRAGFAVAIPFAILVSFNRIAFGAHFLSDVLIAWSIMLMVMVWMWQFFSRHADRINRFFAYR